MAKRDEAVSSRKAGTSCLLSSRVLPIETLVMIDLDK